jgi:hypothetical protein
MPLFGQLNLQSVLARLPEMQDFETEPWELPGAEIIQLSFEGGAGESRRQPTQGHAPGCAPVCDLCY